MIHWKEYFLSNFPSSWSTMPNIG